MQGFLSRLHACCCRSAIAPRKALLWLRQASWRLSLFLLIYRAPAFYSRSLLAAWLVVATPWATATMSGEHIWYSGKHMPTTAALVDRVFLAAAVNPLSFKLRRSVGYACLSRLRALVPSHAISCLEYALRDDPHGAALHLGLVRLHYRAGDLEAAYPHVKQLERLSPSGAWQRWAQ